MTEFKKKLSTKNCPDFAKAIKEISDDESLFEQITHCFSNRLSSFAIYYCKDETLGKDAFQDAMITAYTKLDTFRGDSPIEPWLRRIVTSACSRLRRGRKNDPAYNVSFDKKEETMPFADQTTDQELQLMFAQSLDAVHQEIKNLPEPNRTLLLAHDLNEVPIAKLAAEHEMTQEAVKSRLKRARATVRENLNQ